MKCSRYSRVMAYEQFYGDQERFWRRRRIFCGEIVDNVNLEISAIAQKRSCFRQQKNQNAFSTKVKDLIANGAAQGKRKEFGHWI